MLSAMALVARKLAVLWLIVLAGLAASSAPAVEANSLRAVKRQADSVELVWRDPDPTVFCVLRT